jgi:3D (Asp-Asp-Asp) domain-containing protein
MKRLIAMLMAICLIISVPAEAKQKTSEPKIIGYEYKIIKTKVRIEKKKYLGKFWITHYCPCAKCCGVGGDKITASGTRPTVGRTVGVNPKLIKYGTQLQIGKQRGYVAEDTGGGIGWNHLDVFCSNHQEALNAGVGWEKVYAITYKYKRKKVRVRVPIYEEVGGE